MTFPSSPIAHAKTAGVNGGTTGSVDTTGATLLVAVIGYYNGIGASPVPTDSKSNTWVQIGTTQAGSNTSLKMFYVASPTVGTGHTFSSTSSGSNGYSSAEFAAWSGSAASPLDQTAQAAAKQAGSVTPAEDNELLVAGICCEDLASVTAIDLGFTISDSNAYGSGNNESSALAYLVETTAAAKNPLWTAGGNAGSTATIIATFKAAGGASPITGTLSKTLAASTLSAAGVLPIVGTVSKTLAAATVAGTAKLQINGTLSKTLAPSTLSATGAVKIRGALSRTLNAATLAALGSSGFTGSLSKTLAPATLSAAGRLPIRGTLSATLAPALAAGVGTGVDTGVLGVTLRAATLSAQGKALIRGALAAALRPATMSATGGEFAPIFGALGQTLQPATLIGTGVLSAGVRLRTMGRERVAQRLFERLTSAPMVFNFTADLSEGSDQLANVSNRSGMLVGMPIAGDGVPLDAVLTAVDPDVRISLPATKDRVASPLTQGCQTTERRLSHALDEVDMPALYLLDVTEEHPPTVNREPKRIALNFEVWFFSRSGEDPGSVPATVLNTMIDALERALDPAHDSPTGLRLNLGLHGVLSCKIEGEIQKDPGHAGNLAGAIIPIRVVVAQSQATYANP